MDVQQAQDRHYPEGIDDETRRYFVENPHVFLESFGVVENQAEGILTPYRYDTISPRMTGEILSYMAHPPLMYEGTEFQKRKWLVVLAARQSTKSTTTALSFYVKTAYTPGLSSLLVADKKERADTLHERVQLLHSNLPDEVAARTKSALATRQIQFAHGGSCTVTSGQSLGVGVGASLGALHLSETFLFPNLEQSLSFALPALQNRPDSLVVAEATPGTNMEPSTDAWKEMCRAAKKGEGRWLYTCHPFWHSSLCRRPFHNERLTIEEQRLMDEYGDKGLTPQNLMFRREVIDTDPQIRRNPELFGVYYLFDDVTCWLNTAGSMIPRHAIEARKSQFFLFPSNGLMYQEFHKPKPDSVYIIGVDPAGYGADHASFEVFEVFTDEVRQVAEFGGNCDPMEFNRKLDEVGRRYNNAMIVVERNGVGVGCIEALKLLKYPNIFYSRDKKPGIHKRSHDQVIEAIIDLLLDRAILHSEDLFDQLIDYRGDKAIEKSVKSLILNAGKKDAKRRGRHHWDKVSAFGMVALGVPHMPQRLRPALSQPAQVIPFQKMTYDEQRAHFDAQKKTKKKKSSYKRAGRYRRGR